MKKPNEAARDLWSQIFERAAAAPDAAVYEPDGQAETAQQAMVVQALRQAGWSEAEIERRNASENLHIHLETVGSPGVGPGLEFKLSVLADRVRKVISETGEASQEKVEIGIDPKSGVSASLTNVIMTDEGILTVSALQAGIADGVSFVRASRVGDGILHCCARVRASCIRASEPS